GFALFLFLLIEIFPVIHDAADGRLRGGRNLDQIQVLAAGQLERFEGRHYADLFAFISDYANFAGSNAVIGSDKTFVDTVLRAVSDWEWEIITWRLVPRSPVRQERASLEDAIFEGLVQPSKKGIAGDTSNGAYSRSLRPRIPPAGLLKKSNRSTLMRVENGQSRFVFQAP